jgi:phenylpyruvate tautomerase PptA (4-oxalocrotonate tautomerase family)
MPFYQCITPPGTLDSERKQRIVDGITRIHCEATGALALYVQIEFQEVSPDNMFQGGKKSRAVRLHARIRKGRDAQTRHQMLKDYTSLLHEQTGVAVKDIMVAFIETPYENVMESGLRLPAPGDEAQWLEQVRALFPHEFG